MIASSTGTGAPLLLTTRRTPRLSATERRELGRAKISEQISSEERAGQTARCARWLAVRLLRQGKRRFDQHRSQLQIHEGLHAASAADGKPTKIAQHAHRERLVSSLS
jgi:hypothetical protein